MAQSSDSRGPVVDPPLGLVADLGPLVAQLVGPGRLASGASRKPAARPRPITPR